MIPLQITDQTVERVAHDLMRAVVKSGVVTQENIDKAVAVMRQELKAMLFDDRYSRVRTIVVESKAPNADVLAVAFGILVANCIKAIAE